MTADNHLKCRGGSDVILIRSIWSDHRTANLLFTRFSLVLSHKAINTVYLGRIELTQWSTSLVCWLLHAHEATKRMLFRAKQTREKKWRRLYESPFSYSIHLWSPIFQFGKQNKNKKKMKNHSNPSRSIISPPHFLPWVFLFKIGFSLEALHSRLTSTPPATNQLTSL